MKEAFTCAGILTAIILCIVGIAKLPFKKFKAKYPKLYKVVFYGLSLVLSVVCPIVTQVCILGAALKSVEFAILIGFTFVGVFFGYTSYEGTQLKVLAKTLAEKLKELFANYNVKKYTKLAEKVNEVNQKLQDESAEGTEKTE